jgi:hypothetical protein
MSIRRLIFAFLIVLSGAFSGPFAGVSEASTANLLLSVNRTEPYVAIDPSHPATMVVGTNTNYDMPVGGRYPVGYFTSHDGGRTFLEGAAPLPPGYLDAADPTLAIAASGTVFYAYLAESPSYCSSSGHSAVVLSRSFDRGRSFDAPTVVNVSNANDKPFISIESIPRRKAHVFVTWTQFFGNKSRIMVARSLDGGSSFAQAAGLFTSTADNSGSLALVGSRGRIYVFWASAGDRGLTRTNPARILYRVSTNDGASYGPVRQLGAWFTSIPRMAEPGSLRNLTLPAATSIANGTIFVAWAQVRKDHGGGNVAADIVLTRSTNGGRSWSTPRRVNDSSTRDRFMPALTSYPDGSIGVAFYDRRFGWWDLGVYAVHLKWTKVPRVTANRRVSAAPAPISDIQYIPPGSTCLSPGRFFGDYIGVAVGARDSLYVVWADTQRRIRLETDIWMARVSLPRP